MAHKKTKAKVPNQTGPLSTVDAGKKSTASERLVDLAKETFPSLEATDEQFLKDVAEGQVAVFGEGVPEQGDPGGRVLAADIVVWLCHDPAALVMIPSSGIQIVGARVESDMNLQCLDIPFPLVFKKCTLSGHINLVGSGIHLLDFSDSHVASIDCTASKVDEGVLFCGDFKASGRVSFEYATIGGRLDCSGGQFTNPGGDALDADGIEVKGDVLLHDGFEAEGMVSLVGAKIGGNLECNQGVFKNPKNVAINAERLHVSGDVFLCKGSWGKSAKVTATGFTANGEVKLGKAEIGGTLECWGGLFDNSGSERPAISAGGLRVTGDVLFHDGFMAQGTVELVGAKIGGNLECNKGVFEACNRAVALDAERVNVSGDVFLCEESWGESEHIDAEGFTASGEVKLVRAVIGGDLNCIGGRFRHSTEADTATSRPTTVCSINARGLKITGSVFLSEGFSSNGKVDLGGALVGGNLEFNSGEFINKGEVALDAERAKVTGDVFLCSGCWQRNKPIEGGRFQIDGNINLIGTEIGGTVKFEGASFASSPASSISCDISLLGATIRRDLVWSKIVSPKQVILDLRMARVGRLFFSSDSWLEPGNLRLDGLVYDQLNMGDFPKPHADAIRSTLGSFRESCAALCKRLGAPFRRLFAKGRTPRDIDAKIEWLRLQGGQFHFQPYEQLVAFLRTHGRDADAKTVFVAKARDRAKLSEMAFLERCWHWFLGKMIGYGYRPWRALIISVVVIAFGSLTFEIGHENKIIRATKLVELVVRGDTDSSERFRVSEDYPKFNALVYSLDMFVPLVDLRQASYWLPSAPGPSEAERTLMPIDVRLLRLYMWFHILAGWVLSSLLVVGLSGLVKR